MKSPWLEYEKWYITSWYTVKLDFCPLLPDFSGKKPDFGSGKPDTWSRNLFVFKHIWVEVSITWEFQPNRSNITLKTGFFRISGKSGSRIRNFFGLKPSRDQDGANKKKFSQIGPAVPEEIGHKQTRKQTSCCYIREISSLIPINFELPIQIGKSWYVSANLRDASFS